MMSGLWEPDVLVATQTAWLYGRRASSPEKRLLAAVLMEALEEFRDGGGGPDEDTLQRRELTAWFGAHDHTWPFSFENVCEQLDLNPDCIRARLGTLSRRRPRETRRRSVR